jgi:hypothetical protein
LYSSFLSFQSSFLSISDRIFKMNIEN